MLHKISLRWFWISRILIYWKRRISILSPYFCVLAQKSFANAKSVRTQENGIFQVDSLPCPWGSSCRKLFFAKLLLRPFQLFLLTILSTVLERVFSLYDIYQKIKFSCSLKSPWLFQSRRYISRKFFFFLFGNAL